MKKINVVNGPSNASAIVLGCMRMPALSVEQAEKMIHTAVDLGINFFDHATCYGVNGEAEKRFGDAFKKSGIKREDVIIQSKCGICPERNEFDWTKENILTSVDQILSRLQMDYLDALLLHRPDLIFEPEQVAEAFDILHKNGKVRHFGVSNVPTMQLQLLKKFVKQPLVFNQLQFSIEQSQLIDQTLYVNNLHDITIQAWSPLQHGFFKGCFVDSPDFPELNKVLAELGEKYGVSKTAIAIAWILRHPAKMQAIAGTMNPEHLKEICDATKVELTHNEWYKLYLSSGKTLP